MSDDLDRLFGAHQRNMRASMQEAQQQRDAHWLCDRSASYVQRFAQRRKARERLEAQAPQDERQAENAR